MTHRFNIQDGPNVPWAFMAPYESRMLANHGGQTMERLHRRGGLSVKEAWAVVYDLPLKAVTRITYEEAKEELYDKAQRFIAKKETL